MLFPFVNPNSAAGDEQFNIFTVENLVSSLAIPQNLPAKPPRPLALPPPSPEAAKLRGSNFTRFILLAILQLCIVVFLTVIATMTMGAAGLALRQQRRAPVFVRTDTGR